MTIGKVARADSALGRMLISGKTMLDVTIMLLQRPSRQSVRLAGLFMRAKPRYTMVKNAHLAKLYELVQEVNALNLPGDIVECGVWNGGSAAIMAFADQEDESRSEHRTFWLFDSFEGLPLPTERDGRMARDSFDEGWCKGEIVKVEEIMDRFGIPRDRVKTVPGWFDSTLRQAPVDTIALLHIDADWYESVKIALETLYTRVTPGGFVVLDDYGYWPGCGRAVGDFLKEHEIDGVVVERIGSAGAYFQKPI